MARRRKSRRRRRRAFEDAAAQRAADEQKQREAESKRVASTGKGGTARDKADKKKADEQTKRGQLGVGLGSVGEAFGFAAASLSKKEAIRTKRKLEGQIGIENAQQLDIAAEDIIELGEEQATEVKRRGQQDASSLRARLAAQGIQVDFGTGQQAVDDIIEISGEDASAIRTNAYRAAFNRKRQAIDIRSQVRQSRIASKFEEDQTVLTGGLKALRALNTGIQKTDGFSAFRKRGA